MGRDWTWTRRRSSRKNDGFYRKEEEEEEGEESPNSSGCLNAVFHFFDFHPTHYSFNRHRRPSFSDHHSTSPTGVEAPRNSLELDELQPPWISKQETLQIPMGMKIKTRSFADNSSINSPKTPNLVARLMGLDLLPESSSPSSSSSSATFSNRHSCKRQEKLHYKPRICLDSENITSSRSLPETPRISLARKSNVDYHHRLSLQDEDHQVEIISGFRRKDSIMINDENRTPNQYGKQILKQVRENISRKAGFDITNTVKTIDFEDKLRLMEVKNSKEKHRKVAEKQKKRPKPREIHKNGEKVKKKAQQEQPCLRPSKAAKAINKNCRKTSLSNKFLSFNNVVPTIVLPVRNRPKKQSQLSCSSSQIYRQKTIEGNDKKAIEISSNPESSISTNNGRSELEYVSRILGRTSIAISDKKLFYDLIDELLSEILKNGETFTENNGVKIINTICRRIKSFPRAKCEVLEDIDRLIEGDLRTSKLERGLKMAMEEDGEEIVREIEKEIMEKLVHEATSMAVSF